MNISILSVFPELYNTFLNTSLVGKAQEQGIVSFDLAPLFSYAKPKERIDAPTFGHGAGMLLRPDIMQKAVEDKEAQHGKAFKIFFSPHGKKLDQRLLKELAQKLQGHNHLMLLPARYEGMDARVEQTYADEVISIGDYVLMGGDLPAMVLIEGLLRLLPGVIGKTESVEKDSFSSYLVDFPHYTEPVVWNEQSVPEVIRSGNHAAMDAWRKEHALQRTVLYHFDWLRTHQLNPEERTQVLQTIPPHYAILMHSQVLIGEERVEGTTSVTSIDIHDISRSSATYGVKQFFIVTPLEDQQKIVKTLLDFWHSGVGIDYNKNRAMAVETAQLQGSLDLALAAIEAKEGKKPLVIATSARTIPGVKMLGYTDQSEAWKHDRPVVLVFGTGKGLAPSVIERCDYLLGPVNGLTRFNHLSVRSAVAVILDRWLSLNEKVA